MIVLEGKTIHIGNRIFKAGQEIPKHLEAKLEKPQKKSPPPNLDNQSKAGNDKGKK